MHLPAFALFLRAARRFGSFKGVRVNRFERKVFAHVFDLAGLDVLFLDLRERVVDVLAAERALKVSLLEHSDFGVVLPLDLATVKSEDHILWRCGCTVYTGSTQ